jgi:prophage antirepressor-like protein
MDLLHRVIFNDTEIRIVSINGEFWFEARDICALLGLKTVSKAISYLESDEWCNFGSDKLVNKKGLIALCIFSCKHEAFTFYRTITQEILPGLTMTKEEIAQKLLSHLRKW